MDKNSRLLFALAAIAAIPLYCTDAAAGDESSDVSASKSEDAAPLHATRVLEGKYGWTSQQVCIRTLEAPPSSTSPITPNPPFTLNVPAQMIGSTGVGTATFKADGTMHIDAGSTADELFYSHLNPGDVPIVGDDLAPVCDGTYSIGADNRAKIDFNCKITTTTPGLTVTAQPVNWDGWVADNGRTLDMNLRATVQTETFLQDGNPTSVAQRVCTQRFVYHKLPK